MAKNTKSNDSAIMQLKKQIEEKKAQLSVTKFEPVTNCSLELGGARHNLHTLNKDAIVSLLVQLNILRMSVNDLALGEDVVYTLSGYTPVQWMKDLRAKLLNVTRKDEEARLKKLEEKLHNLLSLDKKVELELNDLMKQI